MQFAQTSSFAFIAVLLGAALLAGCLGQSSPPTTTTTLQPSAVTAQAGDNVSVDYTGYLTNGTVFDTSIEADALAAGLAQTHSYAPLSFQIGDGQLLPGFENGVIGMSVGQSKNITLSPGQAYGEYNSSLVQTSVVNSSSLPSWFAVGAPVQATSGARGIVKSITPVANSTNVTVVVDFNSPLAGQTLIFKLVLRSIQTTAPSPAGTQ